MALIDPLTAELEDQTIIARAADLGFRLAPRDTGRGTMVWEWRLGDSPRPQFVTRRSALQWISEWLERDARARVLLDERRQLR
jgi:hypothetical protein